MNQPVSPRPLARAAVLGLALGLALPASLGLAGCEKAAPEPAAQPRSSAASQPEPPEPADLISEDIRVGTGATAGTGNKVKVNYTGRLLKTNFVFDTSLAKGKKPFEFVIGKGSVIKGWDQGVVGMKVGGKRKLTIPSRLGYADKGQPPKIPGKATLVFDVELLSVNEALDGGADAAAPDAGAKKTK